MRQRADQLAARMVSTGTATDAVTMAAVTSAARALIISSLMFLSLWAINVKVVNFVTGGVVRPQNGANSNTTWKKGNTIFVKLLHSRRIVRVCR